MQPTLLLVDDERGITDALQRMLRGEPWRILHASNASEALALFDQHDIQLLITDYKMPGTDGLTLCRQVRERSPATYRLLLSGQVDYAALRQAWQNGDVHRFVAKPWDNLLLTLDIREGLRQQQLLQHSTHLQHQLSQQEPLLLTDENWVVRHANEPLCRLLNCRPDELCGINLFAPALSAMPVNLETEVTHQTEQQQHWLGLFTFQRPPSADGNHPYDHQSAGAALPPVPVSAGERIAGAGTRPAGGTATLQRRTPPATTAAGCRCTATTCNYWSSALRPAISATATLHPSVLKKLQAASGDRYSIYSPQSHQFLLLLPANLSLTAQASLQQAIRQQFAQPLQLQNCEQWLQPQLSLEQKPANISCWIEWLRQRLGIPGSPVSTPPDHLPATTSALNTGQAAEPLPIRPVFDRCGRLVALELPALSQHQETDWPAALRHLLQHWQQLFTSPMNVLLNASLTTQHDLTALLQALQQLPPDSWQGFARISEADLLDQSAEAMTFRQQLRDHGCQLLLQQFGQGFLSPRQVLQQPLAGVCITAEFLSQLRGSKVTPQSRRLLQKLHEQPLLLYTNHIDTPEQLAAAHLNQLDWLAGDILSPASARSSCNGSPDKETRARDSTLESGMIRHRNYHRSLLRSPCE